MKDLKHIHFYEKLLDEANNDLVRKEKENGKIAVGYTCYYIPEVLLNVGNAFSVRLRAPRTGSLDISQYYMTPFICGYTRALFERAFEGGYNFLDYWASSETCQQMNRVVENVHELKLINNEKFGHGIIDAPLKVTEHGLKHYVTQIKAEILEPLHNNYGIDISDEAIRAAVKEHNEMCAIFEEISEMRKEMNPRITPREMHILSLVSYACPTAQILPYLKETLEDLKNRTPDEKNKWKTRLVVVGSELDDYAFSEIMESCKAYVVADRYCFGTMPGRQQIPLKADEPALEQVCKYYLDTNMCPRFMSQEKVMQRHEELLKYVEEFKADGIVYEQAKFCDYWGYEKLIGGAYLKDKSTVPVMSVDREYVISGSGQLMTRVQAFVESISIKKIQKNRGTN